MKGDWMAWVAVVAGLLLGGTLYAWAGAVAEAELYAEQLAAAQDSIVVAHEAREAAIESTDAIVERSAVIEAEATIAVAEARADLVVQEAEGEAAFRRAAAAAEDNPRLQRLIEEMDAEFRVQGMLADEALEVSAASLLTAQNQIRSLTLAMVTERSASTTEIARLNNALDLSMREAAAWERAAKPAFVRQLWQQGRAAIVVGTLVYVLASQ